jgi:hypothetical protein
MSELRATTPERFSVDEIARAAGVPTAQAWRSIGQGQALVQGRHVAVDDAVHLVRVLRGLRRRRAIASRSTSCRRSHER